MSFRCDDRIASVAVGGNHWVLFGRSTRGVDVGIGGWMFNLREVFGGNKQPCCGRDQGLVVVI